SASASAMLPFSLLSTKSRSAIPAPKQCPRMSANDYTRTSDRIDHLFCLHREAASRKDSRYLAVPPSFLLVCIRKRCPTEIDNAGIRQRGRQDKGHAAQRESHEVPEAQELSPCRNRMRIPVRGEY